MINLSEQSFLACHIFVISNVILNLLNEIDNTRRKYDNAKIEGSLARSK